MKYNIQNIKKTTDSNNQPIKRSRRKRFQFATNPTSSFSLVSFVFSLLLHSFYLILFAFIFLTSPNLHAQELSNIGKGPVVTIDGGISVNQIWSKSDIPSNYRKPYAYTLAANLNFSLYGWSIPLSVIYSNQNWSYQQPFNQFSLHPTYKWIRTHIGYSSMTFSSYTLSGHQFLGGGVELTPPGNWKFSAMAGRLQKRILPDSAGTIEPSYYRFGSGFKTEYSFTSGNVGISAFYAKDETRSLSGFNDSLKITPKENLALSIDGNFNLWQAVSINFEYGTSLLTEDTRLPLAGDKYSLMPMFRKNLSSHQFHAFKTMLAYNSPLGSVGAGVERVDPNYNTLGAYYMNNDFVNYTVNYSGRALKDKVTLSLNAGLQKDNLDGNKGQETKRFVNSVMVGFAPTQEVNLSLMYSNFSNYTHVRSNFEDINNTTPYRNIDTLDFTQISQTMGANLNFSPKASEKYRQSISLSSNYQLASDKQADNPNHSGSRFFNGMTGYNCSFLKKNISLSATFNYSRNTADSIKTDILGPTLGARKAFFDKKMNVNASAGYNINLMNGHNQSGVWIARVGSGYVLKEKHNFDLGVVYANRNNMAKHTQTNEITITFTYRYNFSVFKRKG
jgi:hypothetical protein